MRKLIELAQDKGIEKLVFEVVADKEEAARHTAQLLGFVAAAVLRGHVRDIDGRPHDLIVMELGVSEVLGEVPEHF
jgi:L-amino acid N-acyltransferase YncA